MIRLVCFDALHTLVIPRLPVHIQYSQAFFPFFGPIHPDAIRQAFKPALKGLQAEQVAYTGGAEVFWRAVIRRTATGADVENALPVLAPRLIKRFRSKEGYRLFDDALPALHVLRENSVRTALVSNADSRILDVLDDLGARRLLDPVLTSEAERVEKPAPEIFWRACARAAVRPEEAVHVGDELECDYFGARRAGLAAFLLRRSGEDGEGAHGDEDEDLAGRGVRTAASLSDVAQWVLQERAAHTARNARP